MAAHTRAKTALLWTAIGLVAFAVFTELFASFFWIFVLAGAAIAVVMILRRRS